MGDANAFVFEHPNLPRHVCQFVLPRVALVDYWQVAGTAQCAAARNQIHRLDVPPLVHKHDAVVVFGCVSGSARTWLLLLTSIMCTLLLRRVNTLEA